MSPKPVFFVRDPIRFPSLNRSHKRHPATNRPDWPMVSANQSYWVADEANLLVLGFPLKPTGKCPCSDAPFWHSGYSWFHPSSDRFRCTYLQDGVSWWWLPLLQVPLPTNSEYHTLFWPGSYSHGWCKRRLPQSGFVGCYCSGGLTGLETLRPGHGARAGWNLRPCSVWYHQSLAPQGIPLDRSWSNDS